MIGMDTTTDGLYRNILDNLYDGVYFLDTKRRITYWNKGAERITGYSSDEVLGRRCAENVLNHVDEEGTPLCIIGCPMQAAIDRNQPHEKEVYLHHKDGHRVPVLVRAMPLHDNAGHVIGAVEVFSDNTLRINALKQAKALEKLVYVDSLTGVNNRRLADIALTSRADELARYGWTYGVMLIDIDHFKLINDQFGHDIGDQTLKMVAQTIASSIRPFDVVGRWGGEEFIVISPNVDHTNLSSMANRLRALVQHSHFTLNGNLIKVTISIGATLARAGDSPESLLKRVDGLLYKSKQAGRNHVTLEEE